MYAFDDSFIDTKDAQGVDGDVKGRTGLAEDSSDAAEMRSGQSGHGTSASAATEETVSPLRRGNSMSSLQDDPEIRLLSSLLLQSLSLRQVKGDGNCLYRAVSYLVYG